MSWRNTAPLRNEPNAMVSDYDHRQSGASRQHPRSEFHVLQERRDGHAAPLIAGAFANRHDVAELPARFPFGISRRHPAVHQRPLAQLEMDADLLGELVIETAATEKREQAAHDCAT